MNIIVLGTPSDRSCPHCGNKTVYWYTRRDTVEDEDGGYNMEMVDYEECSTCDREPYEICEKCPHE